MKKASIEIKILIISLVISLFGIMVFAIISFIDYSWLVGWIVGAFASIITFVIGFLSYRMFFRKANEREKIRLRVFLATILRIFFSFIIHISIFFIVMYIDKHESNLDMWDFGTESLFFPINLFTYLAGIGVISISTFVASFLFRKGR